MTTDDNTPIDTTEELVITIQPRTEEAEVFADLVAQEVASTLHNLGTCEVSKIGDWAHPDNPTDRRVRLRKLAAFAKSGLRVVVMAGELDE